MADLTMKYWDIKDNAWRELKDARVVEIPELEGFKFAVGTIQNGAESVTELESGYSLCGRPGLDYESASEALERIAHHVKSGYITPQALRKAIDKAIEKRGPPNG